jgi:hypothetical protein
MDILFSEGRNRNADNETLSEQSRAASIGRLLLAFCIIAGAIFLLDRASDGSNSSPAGYEGGAR